MLKKNMPIHAYKNSKQFEVILKYAAASSHKIEVIKDDISKRPVEGHVDPGDI